MTSSARPYVPRLNPACNVRSLMISPREAFVLSRVDGFSTAVEIGLMTGMGDSVHEMLAKLYTLGALLDPPAGVEAPAAGGTPQTPTPPRAAPTPTPAAAAARTPTPAPAVARTPTPAPSSGRGGSMVPAPLSAADVAALAEDVEIEPDRRARILELFNALEEISHYEVLGVEAGADKKQIKKAYYDLAQEFHPDRYFRKNVGSFKGRLETIFKRITEAHDVLTRNQTRSQYDAELASRPPRRKPAPLRPPPTNTPNLPAFKAVTVPPAQATPTPGAPSSVPSIAASFAHPPPPRISQIPDMPPVESASSGDRISSVPASSSDRPVNEDDRRRALAARLSGRLSGRPPASEPAAPSQPPSSPASAANARDSLRRMAVTRQIEQHRGQIDRYIAVAEECIARDDAVGALNAYRLALSLDTSSQQLTQLVREWSQKANVALVDHHIKLGQAEAERGRWVEASRAYVRASTGRPDDAELLDRTARSLIKAEGDMHLAADLARRAVAAYPKTLRYRLTLAEVYQAAHLLLNARREVAEAAKIKPDDPQVQALLKRLGEG